MVLRSLQNQLFTRKPKTLAGPWTNEKIVFQERCSSLISLSLDSAITIRLRTFCTAFIQMWNGSFYHARMTDQENIVNSIEFQIFMHNCIFPNLYIINTVFMHKVKNATCWHNLPEVGLASRRHIDTSEPLLMRDYLNFCQPFIRIQSANFVYSRIFLNFL